MRHVMLLSVVLAFVASPSSAQTCGGGVFVAEKASQLTEACRSMNKFASSGATSGEECEVAACINFMLGFFGAAMIYGHEENSSPSSFCPPANGWSYKQAASDYVKFIDMNGIKDPDAPAFASFGVAMQNVYPCKN